MKEEVVFNYCVQILSIDISILLYENLDPRCGTFFS